MVLEYFIFFLFTGCKKYTIFSLHINVQGAVKVEFSSGPNTKGTEKHNI